MIEGAERRGELKPGGTVVEATAGNTGLGLALVARAKGYRVVLVVPDKMSSEKVLHLKALGAEVNLTRSDVGKGHPEYYQDAAARIAAEIPGAFFANQFGNPDNPRRARTDHRARDLAAVRSPARCDRRRRRIGRNVDGTDALLPQSRAQLWSSCSPILPARSSPTTSRPA